MADSRAPQPVRFLPLLVAAALAAFGANSILCRAALDSESIDPLSFALLRVTSGAIVLLVVLGIRGRGRRSGPGARRWSTPDWIAATMLAVYLVPFSWAYTQVQAGTGALLLFGAVQSTLLLAALVSGERPRANQWLAIGLAFGGLCLLAAPGAQAPPAGGAVAMGLAGAAWGFYTLRGRRAGDPVAATATNFVAATPMVLAAAAAATFSSFRFHTTVDGVVLAVASGALASALGYIAWYAAMRSLSATCAALLQLAVPLLAATGGVVLLGEPLHARLVVAGLVVVGGFALAFVVPSARRSKPRLDQEASPSTDSRATWASQIARTRSNVSASAGVLSGR
jgi:drug/metabolite transporter (DMT)-like permease